MSSKIQTLNPRNFTIIEIFAELIKNGSDYNLPMKDMEVKAMSVSKSSIHYFSSK